MELEILRKRALESACAAKFKPFTQDDKPIKCAGHLVYTFNPPERDSPAR